MVQVVASLAILSTAAVRVSAQATKKKPPRPIRLKAVSLKQPIIWGSECAGPDGFALAFGGQDQASGDGRPHTRIKVDGQWKPIVDKLRKANPLQLLRRDVWTVRGKLKDAVAKARFAYFEGKPSAAEAASLMKTAAGQIVAVKAELTAKAGTLQAYSRGQGKRALGHVTPAAAAVKKTAGRLTKALSADDIKNLHAAQIHLERAAAALGAEPPGRALSPIVYDAKSKLFVLFGGDHLDYLTNDTWVFDPATTQWRQRHAKAAPPPRANHTLVAADGKVTLTGGYTYFNDIWYCGGPYLNLGDGAWVYDIAADRWTSPAGRNGTDDDTRVYRRKEFHPDFFLQGPAPDAAAFAKKLKELPANTWVRTKPPHRPKMNRDWGTAVIAPAYDVMLRFSGGHSAHGGSDVPIFHFATNRWELTFPIELPLGQTYSNTSYPTGYNLNRRPWPTGHTYKSYAFDPVSKLMVFVGQRSEFFLFDPAVGDWVGKAAKPKGMSYNSCFYTLMCCRTPGAIVCWTKLGTMFRFDGRARQWKPFKTNGETLPGAHVDSSGIDCNTKRNRMLLFPARYGKGTYDGQVISVDLTTGRAAKLNPAGVDGIKVAPKLFRESCYVPAADLVLFAGTSLPPGNDGIRATPAYDCASNRWVALKIPGPHPAGKRGRDVSLGQMYDAKRGLIWCVDTNGNIFVCRLDPKTVAKRDL